MPQNIYDDIFTIFPNPAKNKLLINYHQENNKDIVVKISDVRGAIIYENDLSNSEISLVAFESGIYFVKLYNANGLLAVQKLVISK